MLTEKRSKLQLEIVCSCYNCEGDIFCLPTPSCLFPLQLKWENSLFTYSHFDCSHLPTLGQKVILFKIIYSSF